MGQEEVDFNDFLQYFDDSKLVTSGCVYMNRKNKDSITGNPGYTHRKHAEDEYCYLEEYERKNDCSLATRTDGWDGEPVTYLPNEPAPELQPGFMSELAESNNNNDNNNESEGFYKSYCDDNNNNTNNSSSEEGESDQ
jgi:hypothetical protein